MIVSWLEKVRQLFQFVLKIRTGFVKNVVGYQESSVVDVLLKGLQDFCEGNRDSTRSKF